MEGEETRKGGKTSFMTNAFKKRLYAGKKPGKSSEAGVTTREEIMVNRKEEQNGKENQEEKSTESGERVVGRVFRLKMKGVNRRLERRRGLVRGQVCSERDVWLKAFRVARECRKPVKKERGNTHPQRRERGIYPGIFIPWE